MSDTRPSGPSSPSPETLALMWDRPCDMEFAGFIYASSQLDVRTELEKGGWDETVISVIKKLRFHLHMECVSLGTSHLSQAVLDSMEGGYNAISEERERLEAQDRAKAEADAQVKIDIEGTTYRGGADYAESGGGTTRYTPGPGEPGPTRGGPVIEPGGDHTPRLYPPDDGE